MIKLIYSREAVSCALRAQIPLFSSFDAFFGESGRVQYLFSTGLPRRRYYSK